MEHAAHNATYTSPSIQNEIVFICDGIIHENIIRTIPKYWSVMADKTQDCGIMEQLSICVRYVNSTCEVCEDFLGFIKVEKMDAQSLANALLSALQNWGLDISDPVGQGYDGASRPRIRS